MKNSSMLIKNTFIAAMGKIFTQIAQILVLPYLTATLSTGEYGDYDFILYLVLLLAPFITLMTEEFIFRKAVDSSKQKMKIYFSSSIFFITVTTSLFLLILLFIKIIFNFHYCLYLGLFTVSFSFFTLLQFFARGRGKVIIYSVSQFLVSFINVVLNILFVLILKLGVSGLLLANVISYVVTIMYLCISLSAKNYLSIKMVSIKQIKQMLKYSLPLFPNGISWIISSFSERFIIITHLGNSYNGIYSVSNKFPNISNILYGFFNIAWSENAIKNLNNDDRGTYYCKIHKIVKRLMISFAFLMISTLTIIYWFLVDVSFSDSYLYIPILLLSIYYFDMAKFLESIFIAYNDTQSIGKTILMPLILNCLLNVIFINKFSLFAVAVSNLISNVILYYIRIIKLRKYVQLAIFEYFDIYILVTYCTLLFAYYSHNTIINVTSILFSILFSIVCNKVIINFFFGILKRVLFRKGGKV